MTESVIYLSISILYYYGGTVSLFLALLQLECIHNSFDAFSTLKQSFIRFILNRIYTTQLLVIIFYGNYIYIYSLSSLSEMDIL